MFKYTIFRLIAQPVCKYLPFVFIIVLSLGMKTVMFYMGMGQYYFTLYLLAGYVTIAYLMVLCTSITKWTRRIMLYPITYVLLCYNEIELFLYFKFHNYITTETIGIFFDTNWNEAKEFFQSYVSWWTCFGIIIPFVIIYGIVRLCEHININNCWYRVISVAVVICCICAFIHNPAPFNYGDNMMSTFIFKPREHVDMRKHLTFPKLEEANTNHPTTVVVIIGESFARGHSSLYGYEKHTNPRLEKLQKAGNLYVFSNVTSPALITKEVFKYILNTYRGESYGGTKAWYDYTTVIEVLNTVKYRTKWFSNQEKKGVTADNLPAGHSALCDEEIFNDKSVTKYDEYLLSLNPYGDEKCRAVFYHLMGQHPAYRERYPKEWEYFKITEYDRYPQKQRDGRAAYDNACLYNDYVVSGLMSKFVDDDAIVFYFSDHGLDVYESDEDFSGHANSQNPTSLKVGKEIPFMIYLSEKYKENHPFEVKRIEKALDKEFCTDSFIFAIMDICGFKFVGNQDVNAFSCF